MLGHKLLKKRSENDEDEDDEDDNLSIDSLNESTQGSVHQSRLLAQFAFQCCNLSQLLNISICNFNLPFWGVQSWF